MPYPLTVRETPRRSVLGDVGLRLSSAQLFHALLRSAGSCTWHTPLPASDSLMRLDILSVVSTLKTYSRTHKSVVQRMRAVTITPFKK